MTDRVKGFAVTLEKDIRIDDVEPIMDAIRMIKGIADVTPSISNLDDSINRSRFKNEFLDKLYTFIQTELK